MNKKEKEGMIDDGIRFDLVMISHGIGIRDPVAGLELVILICHVDGPPEEKTWCYWLKSLDTSKSVTRECYSYKQF